MDKSSNIINIFIDSINSVLNSNSFLLEIELKDRPKEIKTFLTELIKSKEFKKIMI